MQIHGFTTIRPLKMAMAEPNNFIKWFQDAGGTLDTHAMGITDFPLSEGGRGAVALKDIPVTFSSTSLSAREPDYCSCLGRPRTLHHPKTVSSVNTHLSVTRTDWLRRMETAWIASRMGRPNPLHDVGGFSHKRVEVVWLHGCVHVTCWQTTSVIDP
jgi:hypothetical protein